MNKRLLHASGSDGSNAADHARAVASDGAHAARLPKPNSSGTGSMIQEFALQTLDAVGAVVDVVDWGVYDVLLPPEKVRRITFDVDVAQEREDCELVSFGTPFLESLIHAAKDRGRIQVRRIQTRVDPPAANIDEKWPNLVHFVKCKPPRSVRWWGEEGLFLLCRFQVTYQGDEIVEAVVPVLMDAYSLADVTPWLASLETHWFTLGPDLAGKEGLDTRTGSATTHHLPVSMPCSLTDVLAWAGKAVQPEIQKRIQRLVTENQAQLVDELKTSRHYYETTLQTLQRQVANTTDVARLERLQQKIAATKQDQAHRMEDISRAYDVSADVRLDQVILYRAPVICVETEVQQRLDNFSHIFRYYPWAATWSPIVCPLCKETTVQLQRGGIDWHCGCGGGGKTVAGRSGFDSGASYVPS